MMRKRGILASLLGLALLIPAPGAAAPLQRPAAWMSLRDTAPLPRPIETGRQKVGDVELYYAMYGKGQPVVLLHPGLGHGDYWANQVGPLSQTYQVIVVDLRGHGRSTGSDTPLTYRLLADDVLRLMQTLHLRKPAVVGWGDGAVVALELAMRHPARVGKVVAFGLTYDVSGQQAAPDGTSTFADYVQKARADYERLSPQPARYLDTFRQLEALWAGAPRYTAGDLGKVRTPVTIMAAEHDEWVRPDHMREAAQLIPNARLVVVRNASHFAPWQTPKNFNDALKMVLKY